LLGARTRSLLDDPPGETLALLLSLGTQLDGVFIRTLAIERDLLLERL
jgi:hypothetical protein